MFFPEFRENRENRETREGEPTATQNRRTRMPVRYSTLPYYCWLVVKELRSSLYSVCPIRAGLFREFHVFPIFPNFPVGCSIFPIFLIFDENRENREIELNSEPVYTIIENLFRKSVQRIFGFDINKSISRWPRFATMAPSR